MELRKRRLFILHDAFARTNVFCVLITFNSQLTYVVVVRVALGGFCGTHGSAG
jgi:hypothetical protein